MSARSSELESKLEEIARAVVERCFAARPELDLTYGPAGRQKCLQDTRYHLQFLAQALGADSLPLFLDYAQWAKVLLASVKVDQRDLISNLELMDQAVAEHIEGPEAVTAKQFLRAAIQKVPAMPVTFQSFVSTERPHGMLARTYLNLVLAGQQREATQLIVRAVETGTPVRDIYLQVFQPTQQEIGRLWQTNQISVAQEHQCSNITERTMALLYPKITSVAARNGRRLLATCAGSELHDIGIRMVADFLEAEGWETFFVGANAPVPAVLKTIKEKRIDLLAISATMTYHVAVIARLISTIRSDPVTAAVKVIVGGYPFNVDRELWRKIGADGYGHDAESSAAAVAKLWEFGKRAA